MNSKWVSTLKLETLIHLNVLLGEDILHAHPQRSLHAGHLVVRVNATEPAGLGAAV